MLRPWGDELPAFQVLFYPVISMDASCTHAGSRENLLGKNPSKALVILYSNDKQVTSETPPAYLCWASNDETVKPTNSMRYRAALKSAGVPVTTRTFSTGGHGFGFNTSFTYHRQMLQDLTTWLQGLDDIYDGIQAIDNGQQPTANCQCYNLSGQAVSHPRHGIFLMQNKRKVIK